MAASAALGYFDPSSAGIGGVEYATLQNGKRFLWDAFLSGRRRTAMKSAG